MRDSVINKFRVLVLCLVYTIKNNQVWFSEDGKITQIVCGIYQLPNKNISLKLKIPYPHPALYLPHKQQMYPPEPDRLDGRGEQ